MPPRRLAPLLQSYAAHQFSDQIMQVLLSFETKVVRLRKGHTNPMTDDLHNNLATLQSQYQQLLKYLELIPGVMMEKINQALMTIYIDRYHTIDPGINISKESCISLQKKTLLSEDVQIFLCTF